MGASRRSVPVGLALVAGLSCLAGCSGGSAKPAAAKPVAAHKTVIAPAPALGQFVPKNYAVTSDTQVALDPNAAAKAVVVISQGSGTSAGTPVQGGTSDVQILAYDPLEKRWNLAFDAADNVLTNSTSTGSGTNGSTALLPQDHPLENVAVLPVRFAGQTSDDLAIYGFDNYYNHPAGILGVVKLSGAAATVVYNDLEVGETAPTVTGPPAAQVLSVTATWTSSIDPECCPVRKYTRTIGFDGHFSITVLTDDRPYLGAWVAVIPAGGTPANEANETAPTIVAVDPNSPASAAGLKVGDQLLGLTPSEGTVGTNVFGPAIVDQTALHLAGDHIGLRVQRGSSTINVPVTLGSLNSPGASDATAPAQGYLGVDISSATSGTPGVLVAGADEDSPAEQAGLTDGDEITAVNGTPVATDQALRTLLFGTVGASVQLTVIDSSGQQQTVNVVPTTPPSNSTEEPLTPYHL